MSVISVKFDVYFKRELGTLFKSNEVDLDGLEANVNLDLDLVENMKINYLINGNKLTDDVAIKDVEKRLVLIPFKSETRVGGEKIQFEIQANMKNGDVKVSQTYAYDVEMGIGEGTQVGTGGSGDGHTHSNLSTLNKVTESKLREWDNKSNFSGSYNDLTNKPTDLATESYVNQEIEKTNTRIEELFRSVSNGKELLASALTDKGIPTLASESFEEIARKILSLGSGEVEELFNLITKNGDSLVTKNGDNLIYKGAM
nr:MAG TPA: hypothetical protein [Bacteriophage sp.]